jgi:type I restriction enzyme R subunit
LVSSLSTAFALASASDYAKQGNEEVGFFQAVKSALAKSSPTSSISKRVREFAVGQLISDASIIDVLDVAVLKPPKISVLSDEFLSGIQSTGYKNLPYEALKKLLAGEIKARQRKNEVEAKAFSDRLVEAVARYHSNTIISLEMFQTLVDL